MNGKYTISILINNYYQYQSGVMQIKYLVAAMLISIFTFSPGHANEDLAIGDICKSNEWFEGWQGFKNAHALRKENSCKTLVYFRSDFCAPCKILKKKIFDEKEFYSKSHNLTKVKVEFPGDWHERRLAEKFGVMGTPAIFVMHNKDNGKSETTQIRFHSIDDSMKGFKVATVDEALELMDVKSEEQELFAE